MTWPARCLALARALRARPALLRRERWSRERIDAYRQQRLTALVTDAARRSRFYGELYGGSVSENEVRLEALPSITKRQWMDAFDDVVTDPRLKLETVRTHVEHLAGDANYLGEYRILASSGTSGVPGLYAWRREDWFALLVIAMRVADRLGYGPRLPRLRVVNITAPSPRHMSYRIGVALDVGVTRRHRLDATASIDTLVEAVGRLRPDILTGYPSIVSALAAAQRDGRLDITPRAVSVSGELCTAEMRDRIRSAWGVTPFDVYAMSEAGVVAMSCEHGTLHVNEDAVVLEPVDASGRPVPTGERGDKLLVTSLLNRTQPVIRLETEDQLALSDAQCPCGRTLRGIVSFEGRSDDALALPAADGAGEVSIHPVALRSLMSSYAELDGYQVTQRGTALVVDCVGGDDAMTAHIRDRVADMLRGAGARASNVRVRRVDALAREPGGKLKLVRKR